MEFDAEVVGIMPSTEIPGFLQLTIQEILEEDDESEPEVVKVMAHFSQIIISWSEAGMGIDIGQEALVCNLPLEIVKSAVHEAIRR